MWYFIGAIAAVLLGAGFVLQQDAAQRVPQSDYLRVRLVADLLRQRRWLAGLGLMIAGMLASYRSTIETHLNWGTSYLVHDLYRRFWRRGADERHYVRVGRIGTALLMICAAFFCSAV